MTQIFTGEGLGVYGSSMNKLGKWGSRGVSGLGQGHHSLYVNAANGNLILREKDGFIASSGLGYDFKVTYNSRAEGKYLWTMSSQSKIILKGSRNTEGSMIERLDEDGHVSHFIFDKTKGFYREAQGGLAFIMADAQGFYYREGSAKAQFHYDQNGLLSRISDKDGHHWDFQYRNNDLFSVTDSHGRQKIEWQFENGHLKEMTAVSDGKRVHHIRFSYDDSGRLRREEMDLGVGKIFWTAFDYEEESSRISDIHQSDGVSLHIEYDAMGRVKSLKDGESRVTQFTYETGRTIVNNELGERWIYKYDGRSRLTGIEGPEGKKIVFRYQGKYLSEIIEGNQQWRYEYNEAGDCILMKAPDGMVTYRTFDAEHHLLSEKRLGQGDPLSSAITTYYLYDERGHLRFKITPDGVVTEYRYDNEGQLVSERIYLKERYSIKERPDHATINVWLKKQDFSQTSLTEYTYDWRGQLQVKYVYRQCNAQGIGRDAFITGYRYDAAGRLVESVTGENKLSTQYFYDDLGRLVDTIDSAGVHHRVEYDDEHQRMITRDAHGLKRVQIFDKSGLLLWTQTIGQDQKDYGTTRYYYDKAGHLIAKERPDKKFLYWFYDKGGRLLAEIDAEGQVSEFHYDSYDHLIQRFHYANKVNISSFLSNPPSYEQARPKASQQDRICQWIYNEQGQLIYEVNADGAIIEYRYNHQGQRYEKRAYYQPISSFDPQQYLRASDIKPIEDKRHDRQYRYYYDDAGRLTAEVDAEGQATEYSYDAMGHGWQACRYFNKVTSYSEIWSLVKPKSNIKDIITRHFYDKAGFLTADLDAMGYLTEYRYNDRGLLEEKIAYARKAQVENYSAHMAIEQLRPEIHDNDHHIHYQYNERGLVNKEKTTGGLATSYIYDDAGALITKTISDERNHQSHQTRYRYDDKGRLIQSLDEKGSALLMISNQLTEAEIEAIWTKHGTRFVYDSEDNLIEKVDALGQTTRYFYDNNGQLRASLDADGRVSVQKYNAFGELCWQRIYSNRLPSMAAIKDFKTLNVHLDTLANESLDNIHEYEYNLKGQIILSRQGRSVQKTMLYDAFGELKETRQRIDDAHEAVFQYEYDRRGLNTFKIEDPDGVARTIQMNYDVFGRLEHFVDSRGALTTYSWDKLDQQISKTDALHKQNRWKYDAFGRVIQHVDASRQVTQYTYEDNKAVLIVCDRLQNITQRIVMDAFGHRISVTDALGHETAYHYDELGNLIEVKGVKGIQKRYEYDDLGRLIWQQEADKTITTWTYDAQNHVLTRTIDPEHLSLTTSYQYDGVGRLVEENIADQRKTIFRYDDANRLIQSTLDPEGLALTTLYVYDDRGLLIREIVKNPKGHDKVTAWTYDALGRQRTKTLAPNHLALTSKYEWDKEGHLIAETDERGYTRHLIYDANGQCRFNIDARGVVTEHRYTSLGQEWQTIVYARPVLQRGNYTEDAIKAAIQPNSAKDRYTTRYFDEEGRVRLRCDARGAITLFRHDAAGNVLSKTSYATLCDPRALTANAEPAIKISKNDRTVRYTYDALNRLIHTIEPDGRTIEHRYCPTGELEAKIQYNNLLTDINNHNTFNEDWVHSHLKPDAKDIVTRYQYDNAGRMVATVNGVGEVSTYQYDALNHVTSSTRHALKLDREIMQKNDWANRVQKDEQDRTVRMMYDPAGRERFCISAKGYVTEHVYDPTGNVIKEIKYAEALSANTVDDISLYHALKQDPSYDRKTIFTWDEAGRLTDSEENNQHKTHYEYDKKGNVILKKDAMNRIWEYAYDENGQMVKSISPVKTITVWKNGQCIQEHRSVISTREYDVFGNCITSIDDKGGMNRQRQYEYDEENHLIAIKYPNVAVNDPRSPLDGKRHDIYKTLSETWSYNAFGEMVVSKDKKGNSKHFVYDFNGQLVFSVDATSALTHYQYDTLGRLKVKTSYAQRLPLSHLQEPLSFDEIKQRIKTSTNDRHQWFDYDAASRVIELKADKSHVYNSKTHQYSLLCPVTHTTYNAFGEVIQTRVKRNENEWLITHHYYDHEGQKTATIDAEGYLTSWNYNAFAEVNREYQYACRASSFNERDFTKPKKDLQDREVVFTYDRSGRMTAKILKHVNWQRFDEKKHCYEQLSGDLTTSYTYDALGHMTSKTDAKGQTAYCYYNSEGQLIAKAGPQTAKGRSAITYAYDALGQLVSMRRHTKGASVADESHFILSGASAQDSTQSYIYDNEGHLLHEIDGEGHEVSFSYDENGNIVRRYQIRHQIDGRLLLDEKTYRYDAENRLLQTATLKQQGGYRTEDIRYNAFGEITAKGMDGQMTLFAEYDQQGQVWRSNQPGYWQIYVYSLDNCLTQIVTSSNHVTTEHGNNGIDLSHVNYAELAQYDDGQDYFNLQRQDNIYDNLGHLLSQVKYSTAVDKKNHDKKCLEKNSQNYTVDRWGNMLSHSNSLGQTTYYRYNAFDQIIHQKLPEVSVMDAHGQRRRLSPEHHYAYDELGQAVAVIDAKGYLVAKIYDAEGHVVREVDALGHHKDSEYNLLGQLQQRRNELGGIISYTYDRNDRLLSVLGNASKTWYQYDEAGKLIEQYNLAQDSIKYFYDSRDNLVRRIDERGFTASYEYDDAGHKTVEIDAMGHRQSWKYDDKGRLVQHTDLGQHSTTYRYNTNGLLIEEIGSHGKHHKYYYRGNGLLEKFADEGTTETIDYDYDQEGRVIHKKSSKSGDYKHGWLMENDHYEYDELGRLVKIRRCRPNDTDNRMPPKNQEMLAVDYDYDEVSNIRHTKVKACYDGYQTQQSEDYFDYDANHRMRINKGVLQDGQITIHQSKGSLLGRDAAGNINEATSYENGSEVHWLYHYNASSQLESTHRKAGGKTEKLSARGYDGDGHLLTEVRFDSNEQIAQTTIYGWNKGELELQRFMDAYNRTQSEINFYYNTLGQVDTQTYRGYDVKGNTHTTITHHYEYAALWDEAQLSKDSVIFMANGQVTTGSSIRHYDKNGLLSDAIDNNYDNQGKNHSTHYWMSSMDGLRACENNKGVTNYLTLNGKTMGDVHIDDFKRQNLSVYGGFNPGGTVLKVSDFIDQTKVSDTPPETPQDSLGSYTVKAGDRLDQIALAVYGDSSLWYLLADANGISGKQDELQIGRRLIIPAVNSSQHQTAETHQVMKADSYGDTSATAPLPLPKPLKNHHQFLSRIMATVVGIVASVLTAGVLGALAGHAALASLSSLLSTGSGLLSGGWIGHAGLSLIPTAGIGFAAGFVGNIASQGIQNAFGLQHGLNLKSALISGLSSAAGIGIARGVNSLSSVAKLGETLKNASSTYFNLNTAAAMIEQDAVSQGIHLSFEKHRHFDFTELAASGLIGGLSHSEMAESAQSKVSQTLGEHAGGALNHTLRSLTRNSLQSSLSGHFDVAGVLAESLGDGIGNTFVEEGGKADQDARLKADMEQKAAIQNARARQLEQQELEEGFPLTDEDKKLIQSSYQLIDSLTFQDNTEDKNTVYAFISFDGTWNDKEKMRDKTNPALLEEIFDDSKEGSSFYIKGVGTDSTTELIGGATGLGATERVHEAYKRLIKFVNETKHDNPRAKIKLVITSFSRGSTQAREFANYLEEKGMPDTSSLSYGKYTRYFATPKIKTMVLFDTVASIGIPGAHFGFRLHIPKGVEHVLHITAKDEQRLAFPLTSVLDKNHPHDQRLTEIVLPGAHSDIGGGYHNPYSRIALDMSYRYLKKLDIPLKPNLYPAPSLSEPVLRTHDSRYIIDKARQSITHNHRRIIEYVHNPY
ncbi:hypothetical protein FOG18_07845 [Legionella israelensis]|uniref:phospholipase effector Tle1 domain-containing protein n=1 Tax=Legionella israelensis TaxID=454 RepID=UPI00117C77D0|nr:DUF2235 domain-containing protein [Legionella israelensis]QDP72474.1 hypothetical protein FOG18_07845 [Legionella israelensis]